MKIVLFGASGTIGRAILEEALKRKHEVTAAVPRPEVLEIQHSGLLTLSADLLRPEEVAGPPKTMRLQSAPTVRNSERRVNCLRSRARWSKD